MSIEKRLRAIMKENGLNQQAIAELIGVSRPQFNRILQNKSSLSKPLANSLELKLGYKSEWILAGEGDKFVLDIPDENIKNRDENRRFIRLFDSNTQLREIVKILTEMKESDYRLIKEFLLRLNGTTKSKEMAFTEEK